MAEERKRSETPVLCSTGCGFYGSAWTKGMCTVCYSEFLQRQNNNTRASSGLSASTSAHTDPGNGSGSPLASQTSKEDGSLEAQCCLTTDNSQSSCTSGPHAGSSGTPGPRKSSRKSKRMKQGEDKDTQQKKVKLRASTESKRKKTTSRNSRESRSERTRQETSQETVAAPQVSASEVPAEAAVETVGKPKTKKNRCFTCNKKVGLMGFDCRCGHIFCNIHRYTDRHDCTFDHRADARERIRRENPVVIGEKIRKI